jgi:hypothetical protein
LKSGGNRFTLSSTPYHLPATDFLDVNNMNEVLEGAVEGGAGTHKPGYVGEEEALHGARRGLYADA